MTVQGINTTGSTLNYVNGNISIPANSTLTVPSSYLAAFSIDPQATSDITAGNLNISDTVTTYSGSGALQFLDLSARALSQLDKTGSGTITAAQPSISTPVAGGTVAATTSGASSVTAVISGTWSAHLLLEATIDGTNWFSWNFIGVDGSINSSTSINGTAIIACGGFSQIRLRANTYSSGTATITWLANAGNNVLQVYNLKPASFQVSTVPGFIGISPASPTAATVGVASAQALASNSNRKGLIVVNTSKNTISLGLGAAAVLNSGITLVPGGSWEMDAFTLTTGVINAIASAASSNLAIQEFS